LRAIEVDGSGRARGVVWVDRESGTEMRARSVGISVCFGLGPACCCSPARRAARTAWAQVRAPSDATSWTMTKAEGVGPRMPPGPVPVEGRCLYLPRFDARDLSAPSPGRGFGVQVYQLQAPGNQSYFIAVAFAEMLPRPENRETLHATKRDAWGTPILHIDCVYSRAELALAAKQTAALRAVAEVAA
jgi:hypothetical protein